MPKCQDGEVMVSATPLGLAFYDFLISNVKKEKNKQTSVPRKKENTVWELVMILSQTRQNVWVYRSFRIRLQEYLQLMTSLYTPLSRLSVYALVYTNVRAAVRQTNTIQERRWFVCFVCLFVLFSNSVHWLEEPMRTRRNMPWLKGEKGYNNGLWF